MSTGDELQSSKMAEAVVGPSRPCVLTLQSDPSPDLAALVASQGYEVVGPFDSLSQARDWLDSDTPEAAILDLTLRDGGCSDLAREFRQRGVPFLFYTAWDDFEQIPVELCDDIFVERPHHLDLTPGLLARMVQEARRVA
jgi:DNA-binding NtrC family response regulator